MELGGAGTRLKPEKGGEERNSKNCPGHKHQDRVDRVGAAVTHARLVQVPAHRDEGRRCLHTQWNVCCIP